jgi:hypothetical protein
MSYYAGILTPFYRLPWGLGELSLLTTASRNEIVGVKHNVSPLYALHLGFVSNHSTNLGIYASLFHNDAASRGTHPSARRNHRCVGGRFGRFSLSSRLPTTRQPSQRLACIWSIQRGCTILF